MGIKRLIWIVILSLTAGVAALHAQLNTGANMDQFGNQVDPNRRLTGFENDSVEIISLAPRLSMWRIDELLGNSTPAPVDTVALNYQNLYHLTGDVTGHYNHLGNLGSPRLSRIFRDRDYASETSLFLRPYEGFFFKRPSDHNFTNSNIPYTNLTYNKAGDKITGEDRFKTYFSANFNQRMAFGFNFDYLYGRGIYSNQSTSYFDGGIFASYKGNHYEMHAMYNNFFLKQNENGGIMDDEYIRHPENMADGKKEYESNNIPVNMESTTNRNHNATIFLTHRYRLGFERMTLVPQGSQTTEEPNDSTATLPNDTVYDYVPVTSFIHTMKIERSRHTFRSADERRINYENNFYDTAASNDSTVAFSVKNVLGVALLEGFNKYAKAGLTAYISHKLSHYTLMNADTALLDPKKQAYNEHEVYVGGELAKRAGRLLHYNINGEIGIMDKAAGQFRLTGNADLNLPFLKDSLHFLAKARISNVLPDFYLRQYHSNHFMWDNDDMEKEVRVRLEGEIDNPSTGTNIRAGLETIKNYTYLNASALPTQWGEDIKVADLTLTQNFKFGIFHLDNEITWQKTSNKTVLPLPDFNFYHNFYLLTKIAHQVLTLQFGADLRYFTKYNAPTYMPALGQYHLQDTEEAIEIGGFPVVNVYANFQLKRTRFFVMMHHINAGMGEKNYFLAPHYPMNQRMLKFGVSWNFYD